MREYSLISKPRQRLHSSPYPVAITMELLWQTDVQRHFITGNRRSSIAFNFHGAENVMFCIMPSTDYQPITEAELTRLQQIVIYNMGFTTLGFCVQEGFIGEHDKRHCTPIPDHISAKQKDIPRLMQGLIATNEKLENDNSFDAVLAATIVVFGFVFIHPFVDGNGSIHRYLIRHVLLKKKYVSKGIIFPVSAIMLDRLDEYRRVLERFSAQILDRIEWRPTKEILPRIAILAFFQIF